MPENMLESVREQKIVHQATMDKLEKIVETHHRALSPNEQKQFDDADTQLFILNDREKQLLVKEERARNAGRIGFGDGQTSGGETYTENGEFSYFRDLLNSNRGDWQARERLERHAKEFRNFAQSDGRKELRAISTVNGAGGEFIPPMWLVADYIAAIRPARATADILKQNALPAGADSLSIPKIATGTTTAIQATQNTGISSTDLTTTSVSDAVHTVAGGQTFSVQLLEQSPLASQIDKVILEDLLADYAFRIGQLVLTGTGTSGQPLGLLNVSGIGTVAYTDATPAAVGTGKLLAKIAQAYSVVNGARKLPPTHIVMHPTRWAWLSIQPDSTGRPVITPDENGPMNAAGLGSGATAAQGSGGRLLGLPVILDPNIPVNTGAGTNQDPIIVLRASDSWIYEGTARAEIFPQTYANQLSMFARVYNYMALLTRQSSSICTVNGTGLITPTSF